jgi:hypothetical protein
MAKIALSPQTVSAVKFRDREYLDAEQLASAFTRWAEEADSAGEPAQASTIRHLRDVLTKPLNVEHVATVEV